MTIAALILAAGRASRFGSLKQLAPINNKPMLQHCIDSANSALPGAVYTLLGYQSELIKPNITATKIIEHPQWARGIGSSISMGVNYLSGDFDAILIMLGDQPMIKTPYLTKLIDLFNRDQDQIQKHQIQKHQTQKHQQSVCSRYQDNLGVPAIFSRRHFSDLMQLDGDQGAKQLLINLSPAPKTLTLKGLFKDVDYPQDLNSVLGDE
jgi:molybdenum cofactor cytidylyltransferase